MQKNLYYRTILQRSNPLNSVFIHLVEMITHLGKAVLEVFVRRNLGERYFSIFTALFMAIILFAIPFTFGIGYGRPSFSETLGANASWYLFIVAFLILCRKRMIEIKRLPSVFDFARYSRSSGEIHPIFSEIKIKGKHFNIRQIEIFLEPAFFLIIGIILIIFQQKIGLVIFVFSLMYSLSYYIAYKKGDDFVMDRIDERICSEALTNDFSDGFEPRQSKGFRFRGDKPADPSKWRKVVEDTIVDEDFAGAS